MRSKSNVGLFLLYLLAAALVVYSVSLVILSNFNMGNLMVWLLTACVVGYAVFRRPLHAWFSHGTGRVVFWVLAAMAAIYLAVIAFVSVSGYTNPPTGNEQVVLVLGAGLHKDKPSKLLQYRLNKAYEFAAAHPDTLVITSGGQGRDEWCPEGDAMRDYLIATGVRPPPRKTLPSRSPFCASTAMTRQRPSSMFPMRSTATAPENMLPWRALPMQPSWLPARRCAAYYRATCGRRWQFCITGYSRLPSPGRCILWSVCWI